MLDETGFVKKGTKSVGVAPQYCGAVGKIANCQIGVFLAYATAAGPVLLDRELYLPKAWAEDPERRAEAGVPPEARASPNRRWAGAAGAGVRRWRAGGVGDGRQHLWRRLQAAPLPRRARAALCAGGAEHAARRPLQPAAQVVASWPAEAWERLSAGEGSQGPRWYDWACMTMPWRVQPAGMAHLLLARRSVSRPRRARLLLRLRPSAERSGAARAGGGHALAGGAGVRVGQGRGRAGRV